MTPTSDFVQIADTLARAEAFILDGLVDDGIELYVYAADAMNDLVDAQEYLAAFVHMERVLREVVLPSMDAILRPFTDEEIQ